MKNYNVITLRPNDRSDIKNYFDFRKGDILNLYTFCTYLLCILVILEAARYLVSRKDLDIVVTKLVQSCLSLIVLFIVKKTKRNIQTDIIMLSYFLIEIPNTIQ